MINSIIKYINFCPKLILNYINYINYILNIIRLNSHKEKE